MRVGSPRSIVLIMAKSLPFGFLFKLLKYFLKNIIETHPDSECYMS